jgi:hypothetical protein
MHVVERNNSNRVQRTVINYRLVTPFPNGALRRLEEHLESLSKVKGMDSKDLTEMPR